MINHHAEEDKKTIDRIIANIKAEMEQAGMAPMTSNQLRERSDRRRIMATQVKLNGGRVRKEYQ